MPLPIVHYAAAGGIIIDEEMLLVLDRPKRNEVRLPKGHVEPGEDAAAAALRETAEESGYCDLRIVADLGSQVVEFEYEGKHIVRTEHYFLMALNSKRKVRRSAKDRAQFNVLWLSLNQAVSRLTFAAEQREAQNAIAAYVQLLQSGA